MSGRSLIFNEDRTTDELYLAGHQLGIWWVEKSELPFTTERERKEAGLVNELLYPQYRWPDKAWE